MWDVHGEIYIVIQHNLEPGARNRLQMVPKYHITARFTCMAQVPDANLGPVPDEVAQTRPMGILGGGDGTRGRLGAAPNFYLASNMPYSPPNRPFWDHAVGEGSVRQLHSRKT